ncbi:MAG: PilZ domain-containing protein [Hyphomicrobiaceae bacterium]
MTKLQRAVQPAVSAISENAPLIHDNNQTQDGRWAMRRVRRLPAVLLTPTSNAQISAYVVDSSSTGLQIETRDGSSIARLPDQFSVYIPIESIQYACEVVWCEGHRAGVRFTAAAQMVAKPATRRAAEPETPKKVGMVSSLFGKKR